ncbi:TonB-dependent receptor, partial [candidate division KSB1 bacterium]|nr:TonB-dependent receptor [candidate division KSB1 bacterium]
MKRSLLTIIFLLFFSNILDAARSVSGYVVDGKTGETIIGVNVVVKGTDRGAASDGNGYFVIPSLNPGNYLLKFMHIAYQKKSLPIQLRGKSLVLEDVALTPKVIELQDVSIVAEKSELADLSLETGHRAITAEAIRRIPASRNDIFRALKYLPGVQGVDPISPLYSVRGSDTGENLILLDGVPIYNPYHSVSSSGLFNIYAIKNVELMVGGFGAEYGGRNSSVLYITTREGNNQKLHGEFSPSTTFTKGVLDFPVGKNATMMISGRWYYDLFSRFLFDAPCYFYDMNAALSWKLGSRHRLTFRYFKSYDDFDFNSETYFNYLGNTMNTTSDSAISKFFETSNFRYQTKWKNLAFSAVIKSILSPNIYWQTRIFYTAFRANNLSLINYEIEEANNQKMKLYMETEIQGKIQHFGLKSKMDIHLFNWNQLKCGGEWNSYRFKNDVLINGFSEGKIKNKPNQIAGFLEDKICIGFLSIRPGIRISKFSTQKIWNHEYRVNAAYQLTNRLKLKASWGNYLQYIVSINTQEYELSQFLDTYYPLEHNLPSASTHSIAGIEANLAEGIQISLDLYHKNINRTYSYDYNASQVQAEFFLEKLRQGSGESYGAELFLKGYWGKTSGWISYGFSKSTRQFPHIMNGKTFHFDYDRPHAFKAVLNHEVNPNLEFSGTFRVMSGVPKTLETSYALYYYYDPVYNQIAQWPQVVTPIKNNIRLPYYFRLDLGMKKLLRTGFGANLAKYLGAERAFLNFTFGNVLFFVQRNVWFYMNLEGELYGLGTNYFPELSFGYSIQF